MFELLGVAKILIPEPESVMATERKATLTIDGHDPVEFSIMTPVHGNDCLDIRSLGTKTGLFTYDSGFLSTAACKSAITFIDGDKGELLYRGYPIEQLAKNCNFLDVAYLLKHGELPNTKEKLDFVNTIKNHTSSTLQEDIFIFVGTVIFDFIDFKTR